MQVLHGALWVVGAGVLAGLGALWLQSRRPAVAARLIGSGVVEPTGRRRLRLIFGVFWVIAGLLQLQPIMPGSFMPEVLVPGMNTNPNWLTDFVRPLAEIWERHPVGADVTAAWVEIGLGVLLLVCGSGLLGLVAPLVSIPWSLVVWFGGEFLGGLAMPGASWLRGAPGAVLAYIAAAILLLLPYEWWESGRAGRLARRTVGVWLLLGAVLQALPWEGWWRSRALARVFSDAAASPQPAPLVWPMHLMQTIATHQPVLLNTIFVVALVAVGIGLLPSRAWRPGIIAGMVLCGATWWVGQDFGILQSAATDPSSGLPLFALLVAGWPQPEPAEATAPEVLPTPAEAADGPVTVESVPATAGATSAAATSAMATAAAATPAMATADTGTATADPPAPQLAARPRWLLPLGGAIVAMGLVCLVALPATLLPGLLRPADTSAAVADSSGGVQQLEPFPTPAFTLTDQSGRAVTNADLHGRWTVLTFLDSVCSDNCPVIANQLAAMDRSLGPQAQRVQIMAINTNPVFTGVRDVATFTTEHGMNDLPNWHFLTGPTDRLQGVLTQFQVNVSIPVVGMLSHSQGIVFIAPDGNQVAYLQDGANPMVTAGYAALVHDELLRLLG